MEEMRIDSKIRYKRNRVISGFGPHRILEMTQNKMFAKLAEEVETQVNDKELD
ncbi:MAG: hypothetical protein JSW61_04745 [Candidatus Thorarchaeota archaeon]|nr:MAG: hypothetical protein JSW61_04745 [Candidatus Thorarchaeota archaeon]